MLYRMTLLLDSSNWSDFSFSLDVLCSRMYQFQRTACRLFGAMPLSEPMLDYHWLSISRGHFVSAPMMPIFVTVIMIYRTARVSSKFRRFISVYVDLGCVDNIFVAIDIWDHIINLVWWFVSYLRYPYGTAIRIVWACRLSYSVSHD